MEHRMELVLIIDGVNPDAEVASLRECVRDQLEGLLIGCYGQHLVIEGVDFGGRAVGRD